MVSYLYSKKTSKRDQDLLFWRCDQVGRCGARIYTKHGAVVKELNVHSHWRLEVSLYFSMV